MHPQHQAREPGSQRRPEPGPEPLRPAPDGRARTRPLRLCPDRLGIAVSGGGDSVALLWLLAEQAPSPRLYAYTVDHGLRPEAAEEAAFVADLCRRLGVAHRTLAWRWDGRGNLAEAARLGRYSALAAACAADGVRDCALAHTADDNLETFFLGLLRGAGLDGLAGMRPAFMTGGVRFHRPLLAISRAALRLELTARGARWHEDPGNEDLRRDRAKVRQMLAGLDLPAGRAAQSLSALAATRRDLASELVLRLDGALGTLGPDLTVDLARFLNLTPEFRRRTLAAALKVIGRALHAPRAPALLRLAGRDWARDPGPVTLHGCRIRAARGLLIIGREPASVPAPALAERGWDGWRLAPLPDAAAQGTAAGNRPDPLMPDLLIPEPLIPSADPAAPLMLAALGEAGLAALSGAWREARIPRASMLAAPGLWQGERLIAAAFDTPAGAQSATIPKITGIDPPEALIAAIMAH